MIEMERAAGDASHWSQQQYEIAVGGPERISLVVEEEGIVKGFFVARVLDREWEIENIVIATEWQRQGMGYRLLVEVARMARLQSAEVIFLEVRESNLSARALYKKAGFVQTGHRPNYYHHPEGNAVTYRLTLI
jgi:ribosomal-protein-alanine N-acetyltransferase